ncbi:MULTISPECIES: prephenate dehydratase [Thermoanaerobacterium]|jgi:prephenate dehydratase|uniref:Prephenate dehydratase n=3 Tax=Thermoanaerobacterium thermosaccharolyticum TaxID=1517 RepID=D9TPX2_THETC|nr:MULTISPECIES: prephenate dehydratase [Thermoanaerobacterium]TCW34266.1 prephenate dehydratase [Thermohydrogenium kirishiense]ADL69141.1 Prephenate dehydratase [Thermoanaerobacterium thermosaccharolyticum DSM 571]AGB19269.1 prephenate dehydratase [Thermoanaerobacterium thermosaccharolyticum M0795]AST58798.1 prephenate dehydratase [Thermoanaerobacterium thermosaccharolyticum]KAA5807199.1 prephenate dehydratase [Thermoanaerobacterium thermosaccharolyticum]
MNIYYLGPRGTFSEQALLNYLKQKDGYCVEELKTIPDIVTRLRANKGDEGLVPVENSIEGTVNVTLDMMINDAEGLKIKEEIVIPISHCLIADEIIDFEDIKTIISHPQALAQCREYIRKNLPNATVVNADSTAKAVEEIKNRDDAAAIGNARAAEIYDAKIIDRDIQDVKNNFTRFIVLAHEDSQYTGCDKTTLVFSVPNEPGSLYNILGVFADENINMTKIESRPSRKKIGEYVFWVDIEGHRCDNRIIKALEVLKGKTEFLKVLGSYPKYK